MRLGWGAGGLTARPGAAGAPGGVLCTQPPCPQPCAVADCYGIRICSCNLIGESTATTVPGHHACQRHALHPGFET